VLAGFFVAVLLLAFLPQPRVSAATYTVTSNYPGTGTGTLHWAVDQANSNPGADIITFDMASIVTSWILFDGACGDYIGDLGELLIAEDVTITGPGSSLLSIEQRPSNCDIVRTRIIHINGATDVTISGLTLRYGAAPDNADGADGGHGGAIYNETANLTLTDCVLVSSRAGSGGGSSGGSGGDGGSGGAVYCAAGDLTITGCTFDNNHAGNGGSSGSYDGSTSGTGGGAGGDGGAICFLGDVLTIGSTTFSSNVAGDGGRLYHCADGSIAGNGGRGGAVYANTCTSVDITDDCSFQSNVAGRGGFQDPCDDPDEPGAPGLNGLGGWGGSGGAIYVSHEALTLEHCTFSNNRAERGGSSLTQQAGPGGLGGAMYHSANWLDVDYCTFSSNIAGVGGEGPEGLRGAGGHGGAIYCSGGTADVVGCAFTWNHGGAGCGDTPDAPEPGGFDGASPGGSGGAIYSHSGGLLLQDTLFEGNGAGMGGYSESVGGYVDHGSGGAVWCDNQPIYDALSAERCSFVRNSPSLKGGAIYVNQGAAELVNCTIAEGWAREGGGIRAADGVPVQLSFCTVVWNQAVDYGGGIYADALALKGCIVANNTFYVSSGTEPSQGTDEDGLDIYDGDGSNPFKSVTSHGGNVLGISSGFTMQQVDPSPNDAVGVEAGLGSLTDAFDPLYVCTLLLDSPALDFVPVVDGTTIDGTAVDVDQIQTSRPQDGDLDGTALWDSGAFESRIQTATVASDTGSGDITVIFSDAGILDEFNARGIDEVCCEVPGGVYFPHGLLEIVITGLEDEGFEPAEVTLTLTYPEDIPEDAMYWKCDPVECEWVDVTDLLGDHDGDNVLTLTLTDGDDGDMDQSWNGEIHDPGGVVLAVEEEDEEPEKRREREVPLEPASMNTNYMALSAYQALPGQTVQVSVNVCNGGEVKGSRNVVLAVNGVTEQSQSISVSGGSCKTVVFNVVKAVPGTYDIDINGQRAQLTVLAPRTIQASVPSTQDTGIGTAGIIAILVVMGALIGALVLVFKG
jgi:hypothetical protein